MPSSISVINSPLKYAGSPHQLLSKPVDTSVCSVIIGVDPCSASQVSKSPFLRSSAWTRSRHHPHRETLLMITGCLRPSQRSGTACAFYDFFQTCFLPIAFHISPLEMTGKPVGLWPSTDITPVEQIWREISCCRPQKLSEKREHGTGQYQTIRLTCSRYAIYGLKRFVY